MEAGRAGSMTPYEELVASGMTPERARAALRQVRRKPRPKPRPRRPPAPAHDDCACGARKSVRSEHCRSCGQKKRYELVRDAEGERLTLAEQIRVLYRGRSARDLPPRERRAIRLVKDACGLTLAQIARNAGCSYDGLYDALRAARARQR